MSQHDNCPIAEEKEKKKKRAKQTKKDVLPEKLQTFIHELGEIPSFGGIKIPEDYSDEEINKKIDDLAVRYAQDIDFQMNVSRRRQELRLKQQSQEDESEDQEE